MKIVLLDALTLGNDVDLGVFEAYGKFVAYQTTAKDETIKNIADAEVVLTNKVVIDKDVMDASANLKLICITATGMNNVDLEYASQKGIVVKNVAGYSTNSVAQVTFTLLLGVLGQSHYYDSYVKEGSWSSSSIFTHLDRAFFEIKDKSWGIIGLGNIGKQVANIASAFGANVKYYSTSGKNSDDSYKRVELEELMKSDIISIHAPLNPQTKDLITKKELGLMSEGSVLINVGRGGIVNEADLAKAIDEQGILAGLDVAEVEPIPNDNPLLSIKNKDNLLITPHIAWASVEARRELVRLVAKNIEEFIK